MYCLLILYSYLLGYSFYTFILSHYQLIAAIREVVVRETNALTQVHTHLSSPIYEQFPYMVPYTTPCTGFYLT